MSDTPSPAIELEMGYSADEFDRTLAPAMRDWSVDGRMPVWRIHANAGRQVATISIEPRPERVIGALRLPVLSVRIEFDDIDEALVDAFMHRFERGFHRGGG